MLPRPTPEYVTSRLPLFDDYADADAALELVFKTWPANTSLPEVLTKVVTLNRLYSTSVFDVHGVAKHLLQLNIDEALRAGDRKLVSRIATFTLSNGKLRNNYSFATKYCAWHNPDAFQIYDSRVDEAMWHYKKHHGFADFRRYDLGDYARFMQIMDQFIEHFGLHAFTRRQIDKFLWIEGGTLW